MVSKIEDWANRVSQSLRESPCCCIGPQNGEPACPCRMRRDHIFKRNGRWIRGEQDLGPVLDETDLTDCRLSDDRQ